jgi:beta-glucosidase
MKKIQNLRISGLILIILFLTTWAYAESPVAAIPGIPAPKCGPSKMERPWLDKNQTPECRALQAIAALTEEEKMYFGWSSVEPPDQQTDEVKAIQAIAYRANEKLDLPQIGSGSDGPNGIADMSVLFGGEPRDRSLNVTAFPNVITLGATWDRDLARRFGLAMGEEFHGKGMTFNLGPTMNLIRSWHGGRSAETYGEDPYLIAELVVPEIKAMQSKGVIATMKHYTANNQEYSRVGSFPGMVGTDEHISEKALQEIYLPAYRATVKRANVGSVMCAYNRINGKFCCNDPDLLGQLRAWGFDGTIVPDAVFAQRDPVDAAKAGVTSVSPLEAVIAAVEKGEIDKYYFDRKLYYTLVSRFRHGLYDNPSPGRETNIVTTPEHKALARKIAASGAVLLKNKDQALPLEYVKTIAVIGTDAGPEAVVMETGSANVHMQDLSVPVDAIRERAGIDVQVRYERGSAGVRPLPSIPPAMFTPPSESGHGLLGAYYHTPWFSSKALTRVDQVIEFGPDPDIPPAPEGLLGKKEFALRSIPWSAQWTGTFIPPRSGEYAFSLSGSGTAELFLDNKLITTLYHTDFPGTTVGTVELTAGRKTKVLIKYNNLSAVLGGGVKLGWMPPDNRLQRAVEAARDADAAVVFVGEQLGEGNDKVFFSLPGDQDRLIKAVAQANPRTIVVLHTSTAVAMPWIDKVSAVIQAWYPGQEAGSSIADLLFGDVNPAGRLPVTFPRNEKQGPLSIWLEYPGDGQGMLYNEGILVGYRWFDAMEQDPLFPFGHGLSYTRFEYSDLKIKGEGEEHVIELNVKNAGDRSGAEVVQLYVKVPDEAMEPPRQLKGFDKIMLEPGETKTVTLSLGKETLKMFDEFDQAWKLFPGRYEVMVGASSRDIRLRGEFSIEEEVQSQSAVAKGYGGAGDPAQQARPPSSQ